MSPVARRRKPFLSHRGPDGQRRNDSSRPRPVVLHCRWATGQPL